MFVSASYVTLGRYSRTWGTVHSLMLCMTSWRHANIYSFMPGLGAYPAGNRNRYLQTKKVKVPTHAQIKYRLKEENQNIRFMEENGEWKIKDFHSKNIFSTCRPTVCQINFKKLLQMFVNKTSTCPINILMVCPLEH